MVRCFAKRKKQSNQWEGMRPLTQKVEVEFVVRKLELVDQAQPQQFVVLEGFLGIFHPQHRVVELPFRLVDHGCEGCSSRWARKLLDQLL